MNKHTELPINMNRRFPTLRQRTCLEFYHTVVKGEEMVIFRSALYHGELNLTRPSTYDPECAKLRSGWFEHSVLGDERGGAVYFELTPTEKSIGVLVDYDGAAYLTRHIVDVLRAMNLTVPAEFE